MQIFRHPLVQTLSYRVVARLLSAVLQASALLIIARQVAPADFGTYVLGLSVAAVASNVLGLGLQTRALRLRLEERVSGHNTSQDFLAVGLIGAIGTALVAAGAIYASSGETVVAVAIAAVGLSDHYISIAQAVLAGTLKPIASANVLVAQRLLPAGTTIIALTLGDDVMIGYACGSVVALAIVAALTIRARPTARAARRAVRGASGYWLNSLSSSMGNLDLTIVALTAGAYASGIYGAASRLVSPLSIAVSALTSVLIPEVSRLTHVDQRRDALRRAYRLVIPFSLALALASPGIAFVAVFLLGEQYGKSWPVITSVAIGVSISALSQVRQAELVTMGRPGYSAAAIGVGTVVGLVALGWLGLVARLELLWVAPCLMQLIIFILMGVAVRRARQTS